MEIPDPRYVKTSDGAYIAYQVIGDGPVDIAWQLDFGTNLDLFWELPWERATFEGLANFSRLILHDPRGTGLSSRHLGLPNLETRAKDLVDVLNEVGSQRTVFGSWFESLAPCVLLAATEPERVHSLVWMDPWPRTVWAPDYPWGQTPPEVERERNVIRHWGTAKHAELWADGFEDANGFRPPDSAARWWARMSRNACTPDIAEALTELWWETDIRALLPAVQAPTLLLVGESEERNLAVAEHVAALLPDSRIEFFPSLGWPVSRDEIEATNRPRLEAIQRFVGIRPKPAAVDTVLSTVLFTDIVGSTAQQSRLGDYKWKDVVGRHHAIVRETLADWRGIEQDTAGDGFYATFGGPARAIHCALEITDRVRDLGLEIRAGVHTGECELMDGRLVGIAVSTGARVAALAAPSEVLVSQTVKDLVAGSGLAFAPAGEHELKGVPGRWQLYKARPR